jgi:hypothetical protein
MPHYARTLEISTREALDSQLDRIVAEAVRHSLANSGAGILVTRHGQTTFTVETSNDVLRGTIAEQDLTRS